MALKSSHLLCTIHTYSATTMDPNHYEFAEGYTRPVRGQQHSSPQPPAEEREVDIEFANPVYGMGVGQPEPPATVGTLEYNLINPLYTPAVEPSSQGRAEPATGQEYATLEMPSGGSNGVNEYNPYENEKGLPTHQNGATATGDRQ